MENLTELTKKECQEINGGNIMDDFWYGVGYAAGAVMNGLEMLVEGMVQQHNGCN